jgi:hypothetical protein
MEKITASAGGVPDAAFRPARDGALVHLLFVRENNLMAAPFDATSAQVAGDVFRGRACLTFHKGPNVMWAALQDRSPVLPARLFCFCAPVGGE